MADDNLPGPPTSRTELTTGTAGEHDREALAQRAAIRSRCQRYQTAASRAWLAWFAPQRRGRNSMLAGDLAHVGSAEAGQLDDLGGWYACPQRGDHDLYERLLRSLMRTTRTCS